MRTVKVLAYVVTGDGRVCVFSQPGSPSAGVQVPAGTVEPGEHPVAAVLREAAEETGLAGLRVERLLGVVEYDMAAFGRDEVQTRHVFQLSVPGPVPQRWTHVERHAGGAGEVAFELFWLPVDEAARVLVAGHGDLLSHVP